MEVVIDSNVLFSTLISKGNVVDILFDDNLGMFAPHKLKQEFIKHKSEIFEKSKLSNSEIEELSNILFNKIKFVSLESYKLCIPKAKELLGKHLKDEDFVALALSKNVKVLTHEDLLFKIGVGISIKQTKEELLNEFLSSSET